MVILSCVLSSTDESRLVVQLLSLLNQVIEGKKVQSLSRWFDLKICFCYFARNHWRDSKKYWRNSRKCWSDLIWTSFNRSILFAQKNTFWAKYSEKYELSCARNQKLIYKIVKPKVEKMPMYLLQVPKINYSILWFRMSDLHFNS